MKTEIKLMTLAGAQLAANAVAIAFAPTASDQAAIQVAHPPIDGSLAQVTGSTAGAFEKSFLDVPRACKDRSAAFDPVSVGREPTVAAVLAIHEALDTSARTGAGA